ncbi:6,7-dimethyl-8-ribityllumazine synthase [bacterium]|nr:6,7-dimethyl-8-ribityllumazine synthase [bacterium]
MGVIKGKLKGKGKRIAVIASRFNEFITLRLLGACLDTLHRHEVAPDDIDIIWCPGAWEIPVLAKRAAPNYDATICLGAIIRGGTPHFNFIAAEVAKGIAQVGLASDKPVVFGVLTTDTIEQAIERAGTKAGNKGADAALAALELMDLYGQL